MKILIMLFLTAYASAGYAQSKIYTGSYEKRFETENGDFFNYKIILNPDGSFVYQAHSYISKRIPPEEKEYGKGTWSIDKNIISLTTDKERDLIENYTLDLTNTKAIYVSKSPRDKTDRIIPTALRFFQSDTFWVEGKELLKLE